ncbi:MAG: hypothetical protein ABL971_01205 [Vicinamibacterales bacterium]
MSGARLWRVLTLLLVVVVTATLGYFMTREPIQLTDGASNMISVADVGAWQVFVEEMTNEGFFRPLMWPPYRLVMDWSGGDYFTWFKAIHVGQLLVLLLLLARWVRVETGPDLAAFLFGVAVLVGGHTFPGTIREAFPINHFLMIAVCTLGAAVLASERPRPVNDLLAVLLFTYAALSLESGLLVWVAAVWAWCLGWRGVSRWGILAMTAGVAAYFAVRFLWLQTGTPGLVERSTGFGFGIATSDEIQRLFGQRPFLFYAYNISGALLTLFFAEPRGGVYLFVRGFVIGPHEPWVLLNVACATGVTLLIATAFWRRRAHLRSGLSHHDRVLLMLPVMAAANAVFCYTYLKDVVLSVAGVFVAAAAYAALRDALGGLAVRAWRPLPMLAVVGLTVLSSAWAVKFVGIHNSVRKESISIRREWAQVDRWLERQAIVLDTPAKQLVKRRLEADALRKAPVAPWPELPWSRDWFDETQ